MTGSIVRDVLALDWGQARIGVAACDPAGTLAYPVEAVPAGPGAVARIVALVGEYEPIEIVVGLPRSLSGGEGPAAATVRAQVAELVSAVAPLPVRLVDERLSTVTAAQRLREARPVGEEAAVPDRRGGRSRDPRTRAGHRTSPRALRLASYYRARTRPTSWASDPDREEYDVVTSMLDPELKPSPAREVVHRGQGLPRRPGRRRRPRLRRLLPLGSGQRLPGGVGRDRRLPGPRQGAGHRHRARRRHRQPDRRRPGRQQGGPVRGGLGRGGPERGAVHQHPARPLRDADRDAGDRRPHPADQPRSVPDPLAVHRAGGPAAHRPGQRPGQGHQDQEVGVREGAGQAEDASACPRTRRTTRRASCSPTPTSWSARRRPPRC